MVLSGGRILCDGAVGRLRFALWCCWEAAFGVMVQSGGRVMRYGAVGWLRFALWHGHKAALCAMLRYALWSGWEAALCVMVCVKVRVMLRYALSLWA